MDQLVINGPTKLNGKVKISGSKNAALPIIAASILLDGKTIINNVPEIRDVLSLIEIIRDLGVSCKLSNNKLEINTDNLTNKNPNPELIRNLRASILLIAPMLIKNRSVKIPHPGGCLIGSRPIDVHLEAFKKMGAKVNNGGSEYEVVANNLKAVDISADFSVTGTENLVMTAALINGETNISLAAAEPHVQDLCNFLVEAGANITGIGTHNLRIKGVDSLKGIEYEIIPDQIESGTFAIAAAVSKGRVEIEGFVKEHHESLLSKFDRVNVNYEIINDQEIIILPSNHLKATRVRTEVYPGFPTDLQAPMAVLATQSSGTSEIYETIFEGRLGYINELSKMGANCVVRDAHQASITGPTPLYGTRITSFDLRAGATLVIAAIIANGESRLDQIEIIDRGYENIEEKLKNLGANIRRVKLKEIE